MAEEKLNTIRYLAAVHPQEAAEMLGLRVTPSINDNCMWVLVPALTMEDARKQVEELGFVYVHEVTDSTGWPYRPGVCLARVPGEGFIVRVRA